MLKSVHYELEVRQLTSAVLVYPYPLTDNRNALPWHNDLRRPEIEIQQQTKTVKTPTVPLVFSCEIRNIAHQNVDGQPTPI